MIECTLKTICRENHLHPIAIDRHTHKYDEIVYFIDGDGTTKIDGVIYSYKPGTFAYYKAGTSHDESNLKQCGIIWLHFTYKIDGVFLEEGVFEDKGFELLSCLHKLKRVSIEKNVLSNPHTENNLANVLLTAAELQKKKTSTNTGIDWSIVLLQIDENITDNIDFSIFASHLGYSYHRFRHLFKEHFGISPYSYLISQRVAYAKRLIKNSAISLTDIAFCCGFNSSTQFSNIFKKHTGKTPSEYRKNSNAPH